MFGQAGRCRASIESTDCRDTPANGAICVAVKPSSAARQTASTAAYSAARLDTLSRTVADLEEQLTDQKRRFWSAIGHIRRQDAVLDDIAPDHPRRPEIPEDLRDYL